MPQDCLFCKIVSGDIPSTVVYEDDDVFAFRDINPQAPTHVLVIPRKHVLGLATAEKADAELLGKLMLAAAEVARIEGIAESGYRTVINWGRNAGMEVSHLHIHVLGGRAMSWPPG